MGFYQICYTRVGGQERNAGWKAVASTKNIPEEAAERFKAISAGVIRQKNMAVKMPAEIFFIQADEGYFYLCNAVMECDGVDGRGNSFVHAYIIGRREYYERCHKPAEIFGVKEDAFIRGNGELWHQELKKEECLPCDRWDKSSILQKYDISMNCYLRLLKCVFTVLDREKASVCIIMDGDICDYEAWNLKCRQLMFCIAEGMPQIKRSLLTFSTFDIGRTKLFFAESRLKECGDCFDLRTGIWSGSDAALQEFSFWEQCAAARQPDEAWVKTEEFLEQVFTGAAGERVGGNMIEEIYLFYHGEKKRDAEEILAELCAADPVPHPILYGYLNSLLENVELDWLDEPGRIWLEHLYELSDNEAFLEMMDALRKREQIRKNLISEDLKKNKKKKKHGKRKKGACDCFSALRNRILKIR